MELNQQEFAKKKAGYAAAETIQNGLKIGIGTGSTVYYFIEALKAKHNDLHLELAFSSEKSRDLMQNTPFQKLEDYNFKTLDVTVDGADYFDQNGVMIKGGGGALTREKILISCSKKVIILTDETKMTYSPKQIKLPIEILPFGQTSTIHHLNQIGIQGQLRLNSSGSIFITDNGNHIFDGDVIFPFENAISLNQKIKMIPGVLETGIFIRLATEIWIAFFDEKKAIQKLKFNN